MKGLMTEARTSCSSTYGKEYLQLCLFQASFALGPTLVTPLDLSHSYSLFEGVAVARK